MSNSNYREGRGGATVDMPGRREELGYLRPGRRRGTARRVGGTGTTKQMRQDWLAARRCTRLHLEGCAELPRTASEAASDRRICTRSPDYAGAPATPTKFAGAGRRMGKILLSRPARAVPSPARMALGLGDAVRVLRRIIPPPGPPPLWPVSIRTSLGPPLLSGRATQSFRSLSVSAPRGPN